MTELSAEQKATASENQDRANYAALAAAPAAAGALFIPIAGPFVALGIVTIGSAIGAVGVHQGKLARDPPRDDFDIETTLGPHLFDPTLLGTSRFEVNAAEFVRIEDQIARLSDAFVRALERASGAELAGDRVMFEQREAEALRFAERLGSQLEVSAEKTGLVRADLARFSGVPFTPPPLPTTLAGVLEDELVNRLEQSGVPHGYLATEIESMPDDPVGQFADALAAMAEANYASALGIRDALRDGTLIEPGQATV